MTEEVMIFPSDVDAEIRDLERKFSETLRLLGNHVKGEIKGKGMAAVKELMSIAERSCAPQLTFYNHEEEIERLEALENQRLSRIACEAAVRLVSEEVGYDSMVMATEQARIAAERLVEEEARYARLVIDAEIEHQRLADQEALRLVVDMAVHIAEIETNKIKENQASEDDVMMIVQNQSDEDSDKGKKPFVDVTPPGSPMQIEVPSTSSPIPPAVQAALDNMKAEITEEMHHEMDELRADMRTNLNASVASVHQKMDDMMQLLLKAITENKKP
jgi:hypothetical protein